MKRTRILVVDDEALVLSAVERLLRALGFEAECFDLPHLAIESAGSRLHEFSALLCDFRMPNCTGLELVRALTDLRPELPVVMMSGFVDQVDAEEAKRVGVRQILWKPLTRADLAAALAAAGVRGRGLPSRGEPPGWSTVSPGGL